MLLYIYKTKLQTQSLIFRRDNDGFAYQNSFPQINFGWLHQCTGISGWKPEHYWGGGEMLVFLISQKHSNTFVVLKF